MTVPATYTSLSAATLSDILEVQETVEGFKSPTTRQGISHLSGSPEIRQRLSHLKRKWLGVVGASVASVFAVSTAGAEDSTPTTSAACIRQPAVFDGIELLDHATAQGATGTRIYLHAQYPAACNSADPDSCKSAAYVLPGDGLAIAKSCDGWVYGQHIGAKQITQGWVASQQVSVRKAVPKGQQETTDALEVQRRYHFALTHGHGTPVCEAYLQRVNQTEFDQPPYCGRPESTLVPGFDRLQRRWLDRAEYTRLYPGVGSFLWSRRLEDFYVHRPGPDGKDIFGPPLEDFLPPGYLPFAWSYEPPVDVENTGSPERVVIWSDDDRSLLRCLQYVGVRHPTAVRARQQALILSQDGNSLDPDSTHAVFGRATDRPVPFDAIGTEVGIFRYRGVTYFDTFFDNYPIDKPLDTRNKETIKILRDALGVFVHKDRRTQQVCEYYVNDQGD